MGLIWGLFSVIIASVAQLSLGFAASHLPPMTHLWDFIAALLAFGLDARILLLGLLGYLLSDHNAANNERHPTPVTRRYRFVPQFYCSQRHPDKIQT